MEAIKKEYKTMEDYGIITLSDDKKIGGEQINKALDEAHESIKKYGYVSREEARKMFGLENK